MYAFIEGDVETVSTDRVVINNNGIGYEIFVPMNDLSQIKRETIRLYTYFQASENGVALYGFLSREEKQTFELLLSVNGVGPKAALAILGTLSEADLRFAILAEDTKAISKAPGIGPKTAKRIILDLKDKLDFEDTVNTHLDGGTPAGSASERSDAIEALVALGYSSSDAVHAISRLDLPEDADVEVILKSALKEMI